MIRFQKLSALLLSASLIAGPLAAQEESTAVVGEKTDWSIFADTDPTECWIVTSPKEVVNTRDGRVVAARRDEILLMVTFQPKDEISAQLSFTGGYPFAEGSTVNLNIDGTEFELFTENYPQDDGGLIGWAWAPSDSDDAKIVTAMKRGTSAVMTALSTRGTTTKDTFSLLGFTAAIEDAESRCAS